MKNEQITTRNFYDLMIRLAFLALIIAWCGMILLPFFNILLWSLILALAIAPLQQSLGKLMGEKYKLASFLIVLAGILIIVVPGWLFLDSIVEGAQQLKASLEGGATIAQPSPEVKEWPLIGTPVYELWMGASVSIEKTVIQHKDQVLELGKKLVGALMGITSGALQLILSLIIAGFLVVIQGVGESIRKFFRKLIPHRGDEFADIARQTVGNVVRGILGVAFIQAFLVGIGFVFAGVPYAGVWTVIVFIFAVLQIPPTLVVVPVIIYLFNSLGTLPAILWSVFLLVGGFSDNILKPILLGKGAAVPMLVIFLGVIGGFMVQGFIGLFTGAIVVSRGYKLLVAWINEENETENGPVAE